jgi:hypothetical protein
MSDHLLNNIMCLALTDSKFRRGLLTDVSNVVGEFDLDAEERDILGSIKADSVTEFAQRLHAWMVQRHGGNGWSQPSEARRLENLRVRRASVLGPTR